MLQTLRSVWGPGCGKREIACSVCPLKLNNGKAVTPAKILVPLCIILYRLHMKGVPRCIHNDVLEVVIYSTLVPANLYTIKNMYIFRSFHWYKYGVLNIKH